MEWPTVHASWEPGTTATSYRSLPASGTSGLSTVFHLCPSQCLIRVEYRWDRGFFLTPTAQVSEDDAAATPARNSVYRGAGSTVHVHADWAPIAPGDERTEARARR